MYLEGMEQDESVPLKYEQAPAMPEQVPDQFRIAERQVDAEDAEVIDIASMISDLEAGRRATGRR